VTIRLVLAGGEPGVRQAVAAAAADAGHGVRTDASAPGAGEALVDLGLPPEEWPPGRELVEAEAERAARLAAAVARRGRVVRASVLGADSARPTTWQRAQLAAESAHRAGRADVVVLRAGVLLQPAGITGAFRRLVERSRVVPVVGRDAKLEPIGVGDFAKYCVAAATVDGPLDEIYDVGCGEILTGALLVRGLADSLGLSRWIVPVPFATLPWLAAALATEELPRAAAARMLETIAGGLLARRMNAWRHFAVRPAGIRAGLALATGMIVPVRPPGEGRFREWRAPRKKGILWRKK